MAVALWIVLVLFTLMAVPMWVLAVYVLAAERVTPPRPHDPRRFLRVHVERWGPPRKPLHDWLGSDDRAHVDGAAGVVVAEVRVRRDGRTTHEAGGVGAVLDLRLPHDGDGAGPTTTVHHRVDAPEHATPGTYLPVRALSRRSGAGDTYEIVDNLTARDTLRLLTAHRQRLGLLTETDAHILLSGSYRKMRLVEIRATGRVVAGHVEVVAVVEDPAPESDMPQRVRGFLRPVALVAARRSGRLPVTRSATGEYALGPTGH